MDSQQNVAKKVYKSMGRPKKQLEAEERAKREVANSNERRRMQSINNGFTSLRQILRKHNNIEKHSKAAVLHQSVTYIRKLEQDINHFVEQNQILKNFIDNYEKRNKAQHQNHSEKCAEESPDREEANEDTADRPPNKRVKVEVCSPNPSPSGSQASDISAPTQTTGLQSPQELAETLEKEVFELKSLLERERQLRTGLQAKQQTFGYGFPPRGCPPSGCPPRLGIRRPIPINHMTTAPQTPQGFGFHNPYEERPLNLKAKKVFANGCPMKDEPRASHFGHNSYIPSFVIRPPHTSHLFSATNVYSPNFQFNKQGNVNRIEQGLFSQNNYNQRSPSQSISAPFGQDQAIPLIKRDRFIEEPIFKPMPSTSTGQQSPSIDTTRPLSSSINNRTNPGLKDNIELILKAIQHIEGGEAYRSGDPSPYVKHLAEKLNLKSASVLKHLLSDNYRNGNNCRPTLHSVDSLL